MPTKPTKARLLRRKNPDSLDERATELARIVAKRVALTRAKLQGADLAQLATTFINVREAHALVSAICEPLGALLAEMKDAKLPEAFEQADVSSVTLDSLGVRLQVADVLRCGIRAEQRDAAIKWLKARKDLRALVIETVNAGTLTATAKHLIENGKDLPDDLFHTHVQRVISVNKVKAEKPAKGKAA